MKTTGKTILLALAWVSILVPFSAVAQEITVSGQIRPRYELSAGGGVEDAFVSMRARLTVSASLERDVTVFLQVQDVRLWGDETSTLFDFSADIYGRHIEVEFIQCIRQDKKFDTIDDLRSQIKKDIEAARRIHKQNNSDIKEEA